MSVPYFGSRRAAWARTLLAGAVIAVLACVTITVGYGSPRGLAHYYEGLQEVRSRFRPGSRPKWAFLWGEHSRKGFWDYYLLAQLWKTPVPTLIFFIWALAVIARDRSHWRDAAFVLLPIAAFHAAGMLSEVNIGIRHLLPAFPFLFLACGAVAWRLSNEGRPRESLPTDPSAGSRGRSWLRELTPRPRAAYRVLFSVLCAWYVLGTLRAFPHFIPYFNELVGGPDNGIYYLDDSNIDWGQDMFRLRQYLEERHPSDIRVASVAPLALRDYGIDGRPIGMRDLVLPQPGITYFVSADYLQRRTLQRKTAIRFEWLQRYRPVDKVGWSIFVYRFSIDPGDARDPNVFFIPRTQWYADAIARLRAILAQSPQLGEAQTLLAEIETDQARWLREQEKGGRAGGA